MWRDRHGPTAGVRLWGADVAHSPSEDRDGLSHHHGLSVEVNAVFPQRGQLTEAQPTPCRHLYQAPPPFARGGRNGVQLLQRDHRALDRLFTARTADGTRVLCHPPVLRGRLHDGPEESVALGGGWVVRVAFPIAAVLMALGFFMSVLSPEATEPNAMIYLTYVAGLLLAVGLLVLGIGLIRGRRTVSEPA